MLFAIGYHIHKDQQGIDRISELIKLYPNITSITAVPTFGTNMIEAWFVETPDSKKKIEEFYLNKNNTNNWTQVNVSPYITLVKDETKLTISVLRKTNKNRIFFELSKKQSHL